MKMHMLVPLVILGAIVGGMFGAALAAHRVDGLLFLASAIALQWVAFVGLLWTLNEWHVARQRAYCQALTKSLASVAAVLQLGDYSKAPTSAAAMIADTLGESLQDLRPSELWAHDNEQ